MRWTRPRQVPPLSDDPPHPATGKARPWPLVALAVAGAVLATWPHLLNAARTGDPTYIADVDELLYLAWSRAVVLQGEPRLVDAVHPVSGPMMHPWGLFVPPALVARALGLGMNHLGIAWRALAGAGTALGLYVAIRPSVRNRRVALGQAAFLMFDPGLLYGQVVRRDFELVFGLATDPWPYFKNLPYLMPHLRVVPPALALPYFLVHLGLALRARLDPTPRHVARAAVSFGVLFWIYFYFWTTVLLGTLAALALDRGHRRSHLTILLGGLIVGGPSLLFGWWTKVTTPDDWLLRTEKFVAIDRFSELLLPLTILVLWLLGGLLVFSRRRELLFLWCWIGAGLVCLNHQVITGLQVENFHWVQALGTSFSLFLALLAAPWLDRACTTGQGGPRSRWVGPALLALLTAQGALGLSLRSLEVVRTAQTREWDQAYRWLRADRLDVPPGSVVAGDGRYGLLAAALGAVYPLAGRLVDFSALAKDEEVDQRLVLNLFLMGYDPSRARAVVRGETALPIWWESYGMRPDVAPRRRSTRLRLIDTIWAEPKPWLQHFGVSHIVLARTDAPRPHLTGLASREQVGRHWEVWRVRP